MGNLSLKLSYLKKQFKLTNETLAKKADLPVATVERISSGRTQNPSLNSLTAIAKVFNCSIDDLMSFDDIKTPVKPDDELITIAHKIQNNKTLKLLFEILASLDDDNLQTLTILAERLKKLQTARL